jgi:hypothetical protein
MESEITNNNYTMPPEKLHDFVIWLNGQIQHLNSSINDAHDVKNFGREAQFEGMRDAFMRCLNKLTR